MVDGESYGERPCICFQIDYLSRDYEPVYKRSMVWFDREHSIPVCVKNYGWFDETEGLEGEELEQATLIELYGYSDLNFGSKLADADFDKANTEYTFRGDPPALEHRPVWPSHAKTRKTPDIARLLFSRRGAKTQRFRLALRLRASA